MKYNLFWIWIWKQKTNKHCDEVSFWRLLAKLLPGSEQLMAGGRTPALHRALSLWPAPATPPPLFFSLFKSPTTHTYTFKNLSMLYTGVNTRMAWVTGSQSEIGTIVACPQSCLNANYQCQSMINDIVKTFAKFRWQLYSSIILKIDIDIS